jgi:S-adenosylmethionine synthetase
VLQVGVPKSPRFNVHIARDTMRPILTAESVTEGHPDKVADLIVDSILDAHVSGDPMSRVACEALCKGGRVVLAGEITSQASVDYEKVVREVARQIGYTDAGERFNADALEVNVWIEPQSVEISTAVQRSESAELGAGDQGIVVGYATDETPQLMPLPVVLAHALSRRLAEDRKSGTVPWLCPDGKTQVSVEYDDDRPVAVAAVVVSPQHVASVDRATIVSYVRKRLLPDVLGEWHGDDIDLEVNPSGSFVQGGPSADSGLSGRKIVVDNYGPIVRHGGGSFSGKDATKVDRTGAYFCRYVARRIVRAGLARRVELQVAYAIGRARPVALNVETFGSGDPGAALELARSFDFAPQAMIERLGLRRPLFRTTTNYGHFGRPGLPWEADE